VLALLVIELEPGADAGLCLGDAGMGVEVDLLVFETAPQPGTITRFPARLVSISMS
jgi:hypothetical protein